MFDDLHRIIIIKGCDRRLEQIFALRERHVVEAVLWEASRLRFLTLQVEALQLCLATDVARAYLLHFGCLLYLLDHTR